MIWVAICGIVFYLAIGGAIGFFADERAGGILDAGIFAVFLICWPIIVLGMGVYLVLKKMEKLYEAGRQSDSSGGDKAE